MAPRKLLLARGVTFPFRRGWSKKIAPVIAAFSQPTEIRNADTIGWNGAEFRFPSFGISSAGSSASLAAPVVEPLAPCQNLALGQAVSRERLRPLTLGQPEVQLFWALLRSLLTMVATPVLRLRPLGLILAGPGARQLAQATGSALGGVVMRPGPESNAKPAIHRIKQQIARHGWPTVLQIGYTQKGASCERLR